MYYPYQDFTGSADLMRPTSYKVTIYEFLKPVQVSCEIVVSVHMVEEPAFVHFLAAAVLQV